MDIYGPPSYEERDRMDRYYAMNTYYQTHIAETPSVPSHGTFAKLYEKQHIQKLRNKCK